MKQIKKIVCCLLTTGCFYFLAVSIAVGQVSTSFQKPSKQDRIDLAMDLEFEMTKDLSMNDVPRDRLFKAYDQLQKLKSENAELKSTDIFWKERGPKNVGGRTRALIFDKSDATANTIFAGAVSGGIWKCQNFQANSNEWFKLHEGFENIAITTLTQHSTAHNIMYAGTGEGFFGERGIKGLGVWKSTDKGDSWQHLPSTTGFSHIQKIALNKNGHIYVATLNQGLQKSTNGGGAWTKILGYGKHTYTNNISDIEITSQGSIFVATGIKEKGGLYKSTNNGSSWTKLTTGLPSSGVGRVEIASSENHPNVLYVMLEKSQDGSCLGIYKTTNAGNSWTQVNLPKAYGMDNFCRNQAWYDLTLGIDPKDSDHIILGGIDLFNSSDGGKNWTQISQWYGRSPYQYVHADQHAIVFHPTKNNIVAFGNDGGVWSTTNGHSFIPRISARNNGYNVTQFYTVAPHPHAGSNYMLAGAQDNGTQQFTNAGINDTEDIGGGDGAYAHIDERNPNVQIISNIFNNYQVSVNGGNSFTYRNFGGDGLFINPTVYDHSTKKMYAAHLTGKYLRWENPSVGGYQHEVVSVANMDGIISAIKVSPTKSNRLYVGTNKGNIYRIDDAHQYSFREATKIRSGNGEYISSLSIDPNNESKIAVSISNYGAESVLLTTNAGSSWTNIEGNLPDMPVRCVIFDNQSSTVAHIATELGVWTTSRINGTGTRWIPTEGMDNVRVDMIVQRKSDNYLFAATYGRGLYSSDGTKPSANFEIEFAQSTLDITETGEKLTESDCEIKFRTIFIPVTISGKPNSPVEVTVSGASSASFINKYEYDIKTDKITFPAQTQTTRYVEVELFDDYVIENRESLTLTLSGNHVGANKKFTIQVEDDDIDPFENTGNSTVRVGTPNATMDYAPFRGYYEDELSQFIIRADELKSAGVKPGVISGLSLNVFTKRSNGSYDDVSIHLGKTSLSSFTSSTQSFLDNLSEVYSNSIQLQQGKNTFNFSREFTWDGTSNIVVQICFNNDSWSLDDVLEAEKLTYNATLYHYKDNTDGCTIPYGRKLGRERPIFEFLSGSELQIATNKTVQGANLTKNEYAFFVNEDEHIISSLKNLNQSNLGCVEVEIDRSGNGIVSPSWMNGKAISKKSFYINVERTADHDLTLYFTDDEIGNMGDGEELVILRSNNKVPSMNSNTFETISNVRYEKIDSKIHSFTFRARTSGGYVVSNINKSVNRAFGITDMTIQGNRKNANQIYCTLVNNYGESTCVLERSFNGFNFEEIIVDHEQVVEKFEQKEIHFVDDQLEEVNQTYHYRVRVDTRDGESYYSNPQTIYVGGESATKLNVYPNPTFDELNIVLESAGSIDRILLKTMEGRTITSRVASSEQKHIVIGLNDLMTGVYILQVKTSKGSIVTKKVIKK